MIFGKKKILEYSITPSITYMVRFPMYLFSMVT